MPGPMVEERVAVFHSLPLQPVGRFFSIVVETESRFSCEASETGGGGG